MISILSILCRGMAGKLISERSMSFCRRPSMSIRVFCVAVAPKPRISIVPPVLAPNNERLLMPASREIISGNDLPGLFSISSEEMMVILPGFIYTFSSSREATTSSELSSVVPSASDIGAIVHNNMDKQIPCEIFIPLLQNAWQMYSYSGLGTGEGTDGICNRIDLGAARSLVTYCCREQCPIRESGGWTG